MSGKSYSYEVKLKVSPDLGKVFGASVAIDNPYGEDGDFSCDFSDSQFEAL